MGSVVKTLSFARVARSSIAIGIFVLSTVSTAIAQTSASSDENNAEDHRVLTLEQVPVKVMNTARQAAPDVFFTSAESALKKDFVVYRITGRLFREVWHVHVREDGRLLRTESDNQDD